MDIKVEAIVDGIEYTATCREDRFGDTKVTVNANGAFAGHGRWAGRIVDCSADLPDAAYEVLDTALAAAMAD